MARELEQAPSAAPIDARNAPPDMSGDHAFEEDQPWSLPWPSASAKAEDPPSRPPKVWGAEPNLGRIWPVQVRPGFSIH
jgi:hypothetical protein